MWGWKEVHKFNIYLGVDDRLKMGEKSDDGAKMTGSAPT